MSKDKLAVRDVAGLGIRQHNKGGILFRVFELKSRIKRIGMGIARTPGWQHRSQFYSISLLLSLLQKLEAFSSLPLLWDQSIGVPMG